MLGNFERYAHVRDRIMSGSGDGGSDCGSTLLEHVIRVF